MADYVCKVCHDHVDPTFHRQIPPRPGHHRLRRSPHLRHQSCLRPVDLSIDGSMRGVLFIRRSTLYSFHASMPHANGAFSLKILASSAYLDGGYLLGFE